MGLKHTMLKTEQCSAIYAPTIIIRALAAPGQAFSTNV